MNPYLRWGFSLIGEGNEFYGFGGGIYTYYNDLNLFTFKDNCNSTSSYCVIVSNINPSYIYPPPRSNHALAQINSFLYLFGGIGFDGLYSDMWAFDTTEEVWNGVNQEGDIPSARQLFAYSSFGNILAIFGGEDASGLKNDLYIFNTITNLWTIILPLSSTTPSGRKAACAVINLPYIYIYGGQTLYGISNELWQFDIGTSEFTLISHSLIGYAYANCQIVNGIFNIYFGLDSQGNANTTTKKYDLYANQWLYSSHTIYQTGGIQGIAINIDGNFIYYGGTSIFLESFSTLYVENINNSYSTTIGFSLFNMAFAYYKSNLYISGGSSISIYQQVALKLYNPFFVYIDINSAFRELAIACSPGTTLNGINCEACPSGTYSEFFTNDPCELCKPGTYLIITGAISKRQCIPCPEDTFNGDDGGFVCLNCGSTDYCPIGSIKPQTPLNFSYLQSIQPSNFDNLANSNLISQIQLIVIIVMTSIAGILIIIYIEDVKKIDIYNQSHVYEYHVPMTLKKTTFGGAFTLLFFTYAVILISSNGLNFYLKNINEIKTLQPLVILETIVSKFYTSIKIEISLFQYLDTCEKNNDLIYLSIYGIVQAITNSNQSFINYKESNHSCMIVYNCNNCYIEPDAFILATLTENSSFASGISVSITSTSSIPGSNSYIKSGILPDFQKVFAGSVATVFSFSMIPSYFESDSSSYPSSSTGYHISQDTSPITGSQYEIEDLSTLSKLLVLVNFPLSSFGLYTTRYETQTFFILLASLLGSISGALGAIRFIMSFSEKKYLNFQRSQKKKTKLGNLIKNNTAIKQTLAKSSTSNDSPFKPNTYKEFNSVHSKKSLEYTQNIFVKI